MPRAIWSGVVSFGLVSIPVKLYTATESKSIAFHQLHAKCKSRIKEQRWCPHCDKPVEYDEIEKGYEYSKGNYVIITKDDLEKLPLPSKNLINVTAFVDESQIDPVYFNGSYYLEPEKLAVKPYALFMQALKDKNMVAIGTLALRNKERLCCLRTLGGNLMVDMLLYPDEIRVDQEKEMPAVKVSKQELAMASSLIDIMAQDFHPEEYADNYREALMALIQAKLDGEELVEAPTAAPTKVVDLMDALRASVENAKARSNRPPQEEEKKAISAYKKQTAHSKKADDGTTRRKPATKSSSRSKTKISTTKTRRRGAA